MEKHVHTIAEFDEATKNGKVLVDFYAVWCGPCMRLAPFVEELADEHPEIEVVKVDVDELQEAAARYQITSIPTLLLFENGEIKKSQLGFMSKAQLERFAEVA